MPRAGRFRMDDKGRTAEAFVLAYLRAMNAVERRWFGRLDEAIRSSPPRPTFPIPSDIPEAILEAEAGLRRDVVRVREAFCTARAVAKGPMPAITDPPTFDPATTSFRKVAGARDGTVRVETIEGASATPHDYSTVIIDGTWRIDDRISRPGRGVRSFSSL